MTSYLLALALLACGGKKEEAPAPPPGSGSAPAPPAAALEIFVNDTSVAKLDAAKLASWPRLDTLVPTEARRLGTWEIVYLKGSKASELPHPSMSYPDMVPAVFPAENGSPAFGMFDPVELAKRGTPGLRQTDLTEIRIKIATGGGRGQNDDGGGGGGADPTTLVITVKQASGTTKFTGTQILALPREGAPGNEDQKGWRLTKILDAAGVKKYERLVLSDAAGLNLTLDKKDFDDKSTIPFIKLNKQGALRFRIFKKQGEGWNPTGDLRALTGIEVVK